jgi:hypothetical protein
MFPAKNRDINLENMGIKFKVGRNIHGKTLSYAPSHSILDSKDELTKDVSGSTIEINTDQSKYSTHIDQLKNIYGENDAVKSPKAGALPSIVHNSIDISNS